MWEPATFLHASAHGPVKTVGYVYRGLGLYQFMKASPKGRRPAWWWLVHLNSGHSACLLKGDVATTFPVASEIAECSDWAFDGPDGWRNQDPELPAKIQAITTRHPKVAEMRGGGVRHYEAAAQILNARAA